MSFKHGANWACSECPGKTHPALELFKGIALLGLTCGIAGTPNSSHVPSWGFLPDHRAKGVLSTNLVGLWGGSSDSEGGKRSTGGKPTEPTHGGVDEMLTWTPLGTALPVFILGPLASCTPKEGPSTDALPALSSTPTRDTAAAP